jgi:peptide/nickel transport system substrate-binding protein
VRIIYLGTIERAWSPLSPNLFGSAEQNLRGSWKPDPAQARAMIDSMGWVTGPDGIRVKNGQRRTGAALGTACGVFRERWGVT